MASVPLESRFRLPDTLIVPVALRPPGRIVPLLLIVPAPAFTRMVPLPSIVP